ncbi:MAG: hypothetical protein H0U53_02885 [Actinobacteria bacterium]|nr:hypothetical protein [Actinomycetota bacterium]
MNNSGILIPLGTGPRPAFAEELLGALRMTAEGRPVRTTYTRLPWLVAGVIGGAGAMAGLLRHQRIRHQGRRSA